MADYKLQHYVPRCLLRQFSGYVGRKAIDLYNIKSRRLIKNAPIKGQCARDYLYGNDHQIEQALSEIEADYAAAFKKIEARENLEQADLRHVTIFLHIQFIRTMEAAQRLATLTSKLHEIVFKHDENPEPWDLSSKAIIRESLRSGLQSMHAISDLSPVILRNDTDLDFIISDNPVALLNEFYRAKGMESVYGLESSGLVMYLPMSPSIAFLLYDQGVYTIPKTALAANALQRSDVEYLNDLTFCNCQENLYFASGKDASYFSEMQDRLTRTRAESRIEVNYARYTESKDGYDRFEVVSEEDFYKEGRFLFHHRRINPVLEGRLKLLKPRSSKKFIDTHSGRKIVRPAQYKREV